MTAGTSTGKLALTVIAMALTSLGRAQAEPVTDRILSGHQTTTRDGCFLLKVSFNIRIRYVSHFPLERGDEVRISIRPIDTANAAAEMVSRRESLRPPIGKAVPVAAIDFEAARAGNAMLTVKFLRPVAYRVGPGADFESVVIAISDPKSGRTCLPEFPIGAGGPWNPTITREAEAGPGRALPGRSRARAPGPISATDMKSAGAAHDEARAALKKSDYGRAAQLLTKVLRYPENPHSAEAQELLGVVYQKNRQLAEAKAEYVDYLRRYPSGDGAESVRQRLAAIETAEMPQAEKLRQGRRAEGGEDRGPGPTSWVVSGSVSQFFVRDDSFRTVRDPSLPPVPNADKDNHRVHLNVFLSSLDLIAAWGNSDYKAKFRFSGTEEHKFNDEGRDIVGVSALFLETSVKDWGMLARVGRQTRNTGGVLGRFDGALVSWQATPWLRWSVVGGSPVVSRRDEPFKDEKVLFGTSVDFGPFFGGLDVSLFAIQQQVHGLVDRQAIGTELRYLDATRSAFLTVDYDTHFNELNAAIFSGSWTLPDKSRLHGGLDYRKSPYLTTWNALQGQQSLTLFDLLKLRSRGEIEQMALDRTTTFTSANIGYSMALSDKMQLNLDATATHVDGTIASFGVDALPSTGTELYYSAQLIASSVLREGDLFMAGVRVADRNDSMLYTVDVGTRFPLSPEWRINPRLLFSYREGSTSDLTEYVLLPTILMDYYFFKDLAFEVEVGARRTWHQLAGIRDDSTELFFTIGFRYDFHMDGRDRCAPASPGCR